MFVMADSAEEAKDKLMPSERLRAEVYEFGVWIEVSETPKRDFRY